MFFVELTGFSSDSGNRKVNRHPSAGGGDEYRSIRDVGMALNYCPEGLKSFLGSLWEVGVFNPMILKEQGVVSYLRGFY